MADFGGLEQKHPNLNLSAEEQRLFTQVFSAADSDSLGVVTGDVALKFFPERTKLPSEVLGEIWQIADTEDKGFLTPAGFYIILRLIGYAQAGRPVTAELALKPGGPLPRFEGINSAPSTPAPLQAQGSGGPIRVPPLAPDKASQYAALFVQSGAQDGFLSGGIAKQIFDRAQLPNDVLVRIWNLADSEHRGTLSTTEFIIAMHLLASYRAGALRALPHNLPAGLYEAAARRGAPARPPSASGPAPVASSIPRQFSGAASQRTSSPLARSAYTTPAIHPHTHGSADWAISPQEKAQYDGQFSKLDERGQGFIGGEQAVGFFSNSRLPEDDLAQIWDLSDISQAGQLSRDEFAVAMHLIRQQLAKKGPLPATLPANLVPPSMRAQQQPPVAAIPPSSPPPRAKSAAEDLFGLDAFSTSDSPAVSAAQVPQSTGGSSAAPMAPIAMSTASTSQPSQSTVFKPFVPSSSFGQGIVSPQPTGYQAGSPQQVRGPQSNNEDLLGDTDPEVNKKLTNETTELANLSNQVSTLTNQMQEVKSSRATSEQNMSQANSQKRDFEARLSQLRSAYEKEAKEVKELEDRLALSRNETRKIQADLAMVQHTYTGLQEQREQITVALEADQAENANLKERIRQVDTEIRHLKPQLEKVRSDARQQKGLVAINKKQLSTNEAERERIGADLDGARNEHQEATRDFEETTKSLERQKSASVSPAPIVAPAVALSGATSPAASTTSQSTNPFFRRTTSGLSGSETTKSPFAPEVAASPNHTAFDNFFGNSFGTAQAFSPPAEAPPVSFGAVPPPSAPAPESETGPDPTTPTQQMPPKSTQVPPPLPQSRHITSSALPLRPQLTNPDSPTSSTGVAAPASRFGDTSEGTTPTTDQPAAQFSLSRELPLSNFSSGVATPQEAVLEISRDIPGSFPGDSTEPTPLAAPQHDQTEDTFAISNSGPRTPLSAKDDFDSAFAGFGDKGVNTELPGAFTPPKPTHSEEFPPIQELEGDESDSESEKGFDDNFAPITVSHPTAVESGPSSLQASAESGPLASNTPSSEPRPEFPREASVLSQLPTPGAMTSPPTYDQTLPSAAPGEHRDSNQFPAEFSGLPSRTNPSSLPNQSPTIDVAVQPSNPPISHSASNEEPTAEASASGIPFVPITNETAITNLSSAPAAPTNNAFDDFDNEFGDLSEAKPADDKTEDEFGTSQESNFFDEFNPTFDSPGPSKATTSNSAFPGSSFDDFESTISGPSASTPGAAAPPAAANHDWDAMFAGLDSDGDAAQTNGSGNGNGIAGGLAPPNTGFDNTTTEVTTKPSLARTVTTEHDDPILKRLTAMGYARDDSLKALEKFDYNIDKAADYLTSKA